MKLRALDLFCGAGGASMGLHLAGFDVVGVDLVEQPEYPFAFVKADALEYPFESVDFVWASPPCQAFTAYRRRVGHVGLRPNLIPAVREKLRAWGGPHVIENVEGAPLEHAVRLCGSMFGLDVRRHRLFETSFSVAQLACDHSVWSPRFAPASNRTNLRKTVEVGVRRIPLDVQRRAMGIDWMSLTRLSQAIPPAYAEWLARRSFESRKAVA